MKFYKDVKNINTKNLELYFFQKLYLFGIINFLKFILFMLIWKRVFNLEKNFSK